MGSNTEPVGRIIEMPDADVSFFPEFFSVEEANALFTTLTNSIGWRQETLRLYGKDFLQPRLVAWYGEADTPYTYSGLTLTPQAWTPELLEIRQRVEAVVGVAFNSVLLNLYRNERDSVSWHSDDEPELGINPVIASVSFRATRKFQFKHKVNPELRTTVELTHGSLLLMRGATQHFWKHQVPKSRKPHEPRINLTFRIIGAGV